MELRSQKQKKEYAELKITLSGLGYFEENMVLTEMREILQALQMSETCEQQDDNNSSMISRHPRKSIHSQSSSPEPQSTFTVQAVVHHPLDWSPPVYIGITDTDDKELMASQVARKRNPEEWSLTSAKRLCLNSIENAPDSGISLSNATSFNSSPVSEENWDVDLLDSAPHSSTQIQSAFSSTEQKASFGANINSFSQEDQED